MKVVIINGSPRKVLSIETGVIGVGIFWINASFFSR